VASSYDRLTATPSSHC